MIIKIKTHRPTLPFVSVATISVHFQIFKPPECQTRTGPQDLVKKEAMWRSFVLRMSSKQTNLPPTRHSMTTKNPITLIGIDCATQPQKTGLALGQYKEGELTVSQAYTGKKGMELAKHVSKWIPDNAPVLIALDAPLGWPVPLTTVLQHHQAGLALGERHSKGDELFQRTTDRVIWQYTKKRPLDVGADRIARTAHSALAFLDGLREVTQLTIPLAWIPGTLSETSAIEVYPAATLISRGHSASGYKAKDATQRRQELIQALSTEILIPEELHAALVEVDHPLDAVICLLAAADFLDGEVIAPTEEQLERALYEGWIWARRNPTIHTKS
ncbi:MAG: hypothetical protein CL920_10300 [Deltaproteobacteria bacterium]|nr:hypothetical protein [Deltaproteobacteria bacterium]